MIPFQRIKKTPELYSCFGKPITPNGRAENGCSGCLRERECEIERNGKPKESMFQLAFMILRDECPPDNQMYLCKMGEEAECDCTECWSNYLYWAVNGYQKRDDPYKFDRKRDE